jgi:hypothetical protein
MNEAEELKKHKKASEGHSPKDFIPCLFFRGKSSKVMLHFHANGEDIALTQPLMSKISKFLKINILCMEYPGYGLYPQSGNNDSTQ